MNALRHRVGLYIPNRVADDIGGTVQSWAYERAVWARVVSTGMSEREEDGRTVVTERFRVTLRYTPRFPRQARLMWRGRQLRVLAGSDPTGYGERLHLICETLS